MSRASELAIDMRSAVQTYPQMSEDEPGGYCTQADQLMDEVANELERLERVNAELVEALRFYADVADYKAPFTGGLGKLWHDCGETARAALTSATKEQP